jgi:branched-subunit amino acid transport protein
MSALLATIAVGLGTYLSRALFILALANRRVPETVLVLLQFVAPAVLAALIVTLLIDGDGNVALGAPEIAAFFIGGIVAWRTQNMIYTSVLGMATFWIVRALI